MSNEGGGREGDIIRRLALSFAELKNPLDSNELYSTGGKYVPDMRNEQT